MPGRWRQYHRPSGAVMLSDATYIAAVMKQGDSKPHDSTIKRYGDKFSVRQGGNTALAAPAATDGGAAEFDVAITGSGPWVVTVTWLAAGLQALGKGVVTRQIQVTSAGAINTPMNIPVRIEVL